MWGYPENTGPTRMVRGQRYKLVYYAVGNVIQLFDMQEDPRELEDRTGDPKLADVQTDLEKKLMDFLSGHEGDAIWVKGGKLVGLPEVSYEPRPNRGLSGQRGVHWPPPPIGQVPWS